MNRVRLGLAALTILSLSACASLQERLANKIGCPVNETKVTGQLHVPAYTEYHVMCRDEAYVCRQAPFTDTCSPDVPKKTEAKADAPAATDAAATPADKPAPTKKKKK